MVVATLPPVDPADVLAAKGQDLEYEKMSTSELIAHIGVCFDNDRRDSEAESVLRRRLDRTHTAELLTDDWLKGANSWVLGEISKEYVPRYDAHPDGVVRLFLAIQPGENRMLDERYYLLKELFRGSQPHSGDPMSWSNQVTRIMTAQHLEQMFEAEPEGETRHKVAQYYGQFVGAKTSFMIAAYRDKGIPWWRESSGHSDLSTQIIALLPTLLDSELREHVTISLEDDGLFKELVRECVRRMSFRPADYKDWANRLSSRMYPHQLTALQEALESCYDQVYPLSKLISAVRIGDSNSMVIQRKAQVRCLRRRLGEATPDDLVKIYESVPELHTEAILLYGRDPGTATERTERRQKLLEWAGTTENPRDLNPLAFAAIGLGATANQVAALYPAKAEVEWMRSPDVRVFVAYDGLPGSKKSVMLRWVKENERLLNPETQKGVVMRVLALRKEITGTEFASLIDRKRENDYNEMVFRLYCNRPGADPKLLTGWFLGGFFIPPEALVHAFEKLDPDPVDVCDVFNRSLRMDLGKVRNFALNYFSKRPEDISYCLEEFPDGSPVSEMLHEAWKRSDAYKQEAARLAAEQQ